MTETLGRVALGVVVLALIVVLQLVKTNRWPRSSLGEEADHDRMSSAIRVVLILGLIAVITWDLVFP